MEADARSTLPQGMMVGKILVDPSQSCIPVVIANFSGSSRRIKKGTNVGQCYEVEALAEMKRRNSQNCQNICMTCMREVQ